MSRKFKGDEVHNLMRSRKGIEESSPKVRPLPDTNPTTETVKYFSRRKEIG